MNKILSLILTLLIFSYKNLYCEEKIFAIKPNSNFYMNPNLESPVIYPIFQGKEMVLIKEQSEWLNIMDKQTGLVGWSLGENFVFSKPEKESN